VLVRTKGLWGSEFGRGKGYQFSFADCLKKHFWQVFTNLFFFMPKRNVEIEFVECPKDFPKGESKDVINRYLEKFYNVACTPNTYVPYHWYEMGGTRYLPEPEVCKVKEDVSRIPDEVRDAVFDKLHEYTNKVIIKNTDTLGTDLSLDSLVIAEIHAWIQDHFGVQVNSPETLKTVSNLLIAAIGESSSVEMLRPVPPEWFIPDDPEKATIVEGKTIAECFLNLAKTHPDRPVIADQNTGVMSYRKIILAILALKDEIEKIPEERVGIIMPACCMSSVLYLTTVFSGKIPVMINWTVGARNVMHCLKTAGVKHILTAKVVKERLEGKGTDFSEYEDMLMYLEDIGASLSLPHKLWAKFQSLFCWNALRKAKISDIGVILFTSGSESFPKAVPIRHEAMIENLRPAIVVAEMRHDDAAIGMLPPFHSFGMLMNVVMPFTTCFRVVYHANPTEGAMISRLAAAYKATLIVGTPTFIGNILRHATEDQMATMRLMVTGAEKCPDSVFERMGEICPKCVVSEGYGITECGPIVSFSNPTHKSSGNLGGVLSCHEWMLTDPECNHKVLSGEIGMLLLRGVSVFQGYANHDSADPFVEFDGKKWYKTGDLVRVNDAGKLFFCGRLKRFIKLGGEMVSLPAIEEVLLAAYPAGEDAEGPVLAVEALGDEFSPIVTVFTTIPLEIDDVNQKLRQAGMGAINSVRKIVPVNEIPVFATGKTNYREMKKMGTAEEQKKQVEKDS
ncbi:MAG: AMP-binding protein, partial [Lentisphaeria bacterium]